MTRLQVFVFGILLLIGMATSQLVTLFQICEMQCIKEREEAFSNRTELYHVCAQYCSVHAYDRPGNLGTLG